MKKETIILIVLVIISLFVRIRLSSSTIIYPDSLFYLSQAKENLRGGLSFEFVNGKRLVHQPLYPLLIAFLTLFTNNIEGSSVIISAFFGSLVIIPLFFLARSIYGIREAWLSSLLLLFDPLLIHWSISALTDSLFIFLFITVIALSWSAVHQEKGYLYLVVGMVIGLSYLTRVIGITTVLFPILAILLSKGFNKEKRINILLSLSLVCAGIIIFLLPYLFYLHTLFGEWMISGFTPYGGIREALMKTNFLLPRFKSLIEYGLAGIILARFLHFISLYSGIFIAIVPIITVLAILGLFQKRPILYNRIYIPLCIAVYGFVLILFAHETMVDDSVRLISPLLPLSFILAVDGIVNLSKWVTSILHLDQGSLLSRGLFLLIAIAIIISSSYLAFRKTQQYAVSIEIKRLWKREESINPYKEIAIKLKRYLSNRPRIMSRKPFIPYYVNGIWFMTSDRTYEEEIRSARAQGVEYLLIDSMVDPFMRPKIAFLLDPSLAPPELDVVVYTRSEDKKRIGLVIYRIKDG